MAVSTIPALKLALRTKLKARAGLHDVLVSIGWPSAPTGDMLLIADVIDWRQEPRALAAGTIKLEEWYTQQVLVRVERAGADMQATLERALSIAEELFAELLTDATLGGVVMEALPAGGKTEEMASETGEARIVLVTLDVAVYARV